IRWLARAMGGPRLRLAEAMLMMPMLIWVAVTPTSEAKLAPGATGAAAPGAAGLGAPGTGGAGSPFLLAAPGAAAPGAAAPGAAAPGAAAPGAADTRPAAARVGGGAGAEG